MKIPVLALACLALSGCSNAQVAAVLRPALMGAAATRPPQGVAGASSPLGVFDGGKIVAHDGTFLGVVTANPYDTNGIANEYGDHGGKYSTASIFNEYGTYGGHYSEQSPFNEYASDPPKIFTLDGHWAYLSVNQSLNPVVNPYAIIALIHGNS